MARERFLAVLPSLDEPRPELLHMFPFRVPLTNARWLSTTR